MPNIHGSMIHVPKPPKKGPFGRASDQAKKAGGRAKKSGHNAFRNATSKPGTKADGGNFHNRPTFHSRPKSELNETAEEIAPSMRALAATTTGLTGLTAGNVIGSKIGEHKYPQSKKIAKAYVRITDVGTRAAKAASKTPKAARRYPGIPYKSLAGGAAVGTALGVNAGISDKKSRAKIVEQRKIVKRLKATKDERHKALVGDKDYLPSKMGGSGKYTKDERKVGGRIIGKERLKGQAKGWSTGVGVGAAAGVGIAAARKTRKPTAALVGGIVGGFAGQQRGDYVGNVKGHRKAKQTLGKSASMSAFGIDHG